MNESENQKDQQLAGIDPKTIIGNKSKVSAIAEAAEQAVCHGPMPDIAIGNKDLQLTTDKYDVAVGPTDVSHEQKFFSNTIVPSTESKIVILPSKREGTRQECTFKHILLTTDLSSNAEAAVPYAVALARKSSGTIHVFHVFEDESREAFMAGIVIGVSAWIASEREQRQEKLSQMAAELSAKAGVNVTFACVPGNPAIEAVNFAQKMHADLIVISTHGRRGISHLFLGSVAEKIARLSPIPVLTVRPGAIVPAELAFKTILVPTDFSENAEEALPYAIALAKQHGAKLLLAHVLDESAFTDDLMWSTGSLEIEHSMEVIKAQIQLKLTEAAETLRSKGDVAVTTVLKCGRAHEGICTIATEHNADLVVMSTHGYTGFSHLAFGSVAERVLRSCPLPMLSIRPVDVATRP